PLPDGHPIGVPARARSPAGRRPVGEWGCPEACRRLLVRPRASGDRHVRVAVFGLGYVGTVTAACLASGGHEVRGVDPEVAKVDMVSGGASPVVEPQLDEMVAR